VVNKNVDELSPKYKKIVKEMNLLKGNINFTNEVLDNLNTPQEYEQNETISDLLDDLKAMEKKVFEWIENTQNEDVLGLCLLVNEDLQKTFDRQKSIKSG
jgi:hypothetical protein